MKEFVRKIWNLFVKLVLAVPQDKMLHFVAGLILGAFFTIACHFPAPLVAALAFGALKEAFDYWTTGEVDWWDLVATCIGGLVVQVFVFIGMIW